MDMMDVSDDTAEIVNMSNAKMRTNIAKQHIQE